MPEDRISFGESVIATILNGYDIPDPIGKKVNRAEVVILSSTLERDATEQIQKRVRRLYHTHAIGFIGFAPAAYAALRDLYPHERDFLILDVTNENTNLAFVRHGLLVDVGTLPSAYSRCCSPPARRERMTPRRRGGADCARRRNSRDT